MIVYCPHNKGSGTTCTTKTPLSSSNTREYLSACGWNFKCIFDDCFGTGLNSRSFDNHSPQSMTRSGMSQFTTLAIPTQAICCFLNNLLKASPLSSACEIIFPVILSISLLNSLVILFPFLFNSL